MDNNYTDIFKNYPDVITIEDLQEMLHIVRNMAYSLIRENKIKTIKAGKKYIIPKINVINYLFG
ncbi:MAG: helix-turn-helix domain-containing protein [Ruminococcus sp.]